MPSSVVVRIRNCATTSNTELSISPGGGRSRAAKVSSTATTKAAIEREESKSTCYPERKQARPKVKDAVASADLVIGQMHFSTSTESLL